MHGKGAAKGLKEVSKDDYFVMKRGGTSSLKSHPMNHIQKRGANYSTTMKTDIQFTTGGSGIAHAEQNEHSTLPVHFLQIWALPWKTGLVPRYHTLSIPEESKRAGFVTILSPLKAGLEASAEEEKAAEPAVEGTIPVHADLVMGAGIIGVGGKATWRVGGGGGEGKGKSVVRSQRGRKVYVHLPMRGLKAKIRLAGEGGHVLSEGDGAFVEKVNAGDELVVESVGEGEAEVVVLDSN